MLLQRDSFLAYADQLQVWYQFSGHETALHGHHASCLNESTEIWWHSTSPHITTVLDFRARYSLSPSTNFPVYVFPLCCFLAISLCVLPKIRMSSLPVRRKLYADVLFHLTYVVNVPAYDITSHIYSFVFDWLGGPSCRLTASPPCSIRPIHVVS
ncbi:hypothetical protein BDZ91DRAFT_248160 [Kalaharituber pfeilii]|nr:hypothetical protein BDZ91DRAFT_248160 [Kalaharituber pfeilii]